jgi:hypothetical protein
MGRKPRKGSRKYVNDRVISLCLVLGIVLGLVTWNLWIGVGTVFGLIFFFSAVGVYND